MFAFRRIVFLVMALFLTISSNLMAQPVLAIQTDSTVAAVQRSVADCVGRLKSSKYLESAFVKCGNLIQNAVDQTPSFDYYNVLATLNEKVENLNEELLLQGRPTVLPYQIYEDSLDSKSDIRLIKQLRKALREYQAIGPYPHNGYDVALVQSENKKRLFDLKTRIKIVRKKQQKVHNKIHKTMQKIRMKMPEFELQHYEETLETTFTVYQNENAKMSALFLLKESTDALDVVIKAAIKIMKKNKENSAYGIEKAWGNVASLTEVTAEITKVERIPYHTELVTEQIKLFHEKHKRATQLTEAFLLTKLTGLFDKALHYEDPNLAYFSLISEEKMKKTAKKLRNHIVWWSEKLPNSELLGSFQDKLEQLPEQQKTRLREGHLQQERRIAKAANTALPIVSHLEQNIALQRLVKTSAVTFFKQEKGILTKSLSETKLNESKPNHVMIKSIVTLPLQTANWLIQGKGKRLTSFYEQASFSAVVKDTLNQCHAIYLVVRQGGDIVDGPKVTDFTQQYPLACENVQHE